MRVESFISFVLCIWLISHSPLPCVRCSIHPSIEIEVFDVSCWLLVCPPFSFFLSFSRCHLPSANYISSIAGLLCCTWAMSHARPFSPPNKIHISSDNGLCAAPAIWAPRRSVPKTPNPIFIGVSRFSVLLSVEEVNGKGTLPHVPTCERLAEWDGVNHDIWLNRWKWKALNLVSAHRFRSIIIVVVAVVGVAVAGCRQTKCMWRFNCPHLRWRERAYVCVRVPRLGHHGISISKTANSSTAARCWAASRDGLSPFVLTQFVFGAKLFAPLPVATADARPLPSTTLPTDSVAVWRTSANIK